MAEDWRKGDLALCVRDDRGTLNACLKRGAIYTVSEVQEWWHATGLNFEGIDPAPWLAFYSNRFRKIHPHHADEEDRETIRLLNREEV